MENWQKLTRMEQELRRADREERLHRKRRRVASTVLTGVLFLLMAMVLLIVVGVIVLTTLGKNNLQNKVSGMAPSLSGMGEEMPVEEISEETSKDAYNWEEGWIRYKGKIYEYNEDILTFLVMGIDKMGKVKKSKSLTDGGQADALFLVVANPDTRQIKLLGINRDTMVDVTMIGTGPNGEDQVVFAEIAAQHGFGDGMEQSCELTVDAVSKLFYDLPIHGYLSFNMGGIADLNDALGGVQVTVPENLTKINRKWIQGAEVTLQGKDAYDYIHYRDTTVFESARGRLARQKQYLSTFGATVLEKVKKDITLPLDLYQSFQPYIVTDLSIDEISWLAAELVKYRFNGEDIYTLEGETRMGEKFEQFYPDEEALKDLMIQIFYREVDPMRK